MHRLRAQTTVFYFDQRFSKRKYLWALAFFLVWQPEVTWKPAYGNKTNTIIQKVMTRFKLNFQEMLMMGQER